MRRRFVNWWHLIVNSSPARMRWMRDNDCRCRTAWASMCWQHPIARPQTEYTTSTSYKWRQTHSRDRLQWIIQSFMTMKIIFFKFSCNIYKLWLIILNVRFYAHQVKFCFKMQVSKFKNKMIVLLYALFLNKQLI